MIPHVRLHVRSRLRHHLGRIVLALLLAVVGGAQLLAQISGIVNIYAPVVAISTCTITVPSTTGFASGDRILIIQMQGATIDLNDAPSFGTVTSYNNAGNYEFATVSGVTPTTLALRNRLVGSYTIADHVQVVRVPSYVDVTVGGLLTCQPWNGSTGGVLAVEASGTLTMGADIDVSALGFRGGIPIDMNLTCGQAINTSYFYADNNLAGANKGEGIAIVQSAWARGRGAPANAGGGGNNHNGGGGGGSNIGIGGNGGSEWSSCANNNPVTRGIGGYTLDYSSGTRVFMGGGGGTGHANNGSGTAGGAGGAIVIIRATTFVGNGRSIISNGGSVPLSGPPGADGCGGGGGGGTVLLDVRSYFGTVRAEVKGGAGGDTWWNAGKIGPGGGGGGGLAWTWGAFPAAAVTLVANGGVSGIHVNNGNDPWGAVAGQPGGSLGGLNITEGTQPTVAVNINPAGPLKICEGESVTLTATPGFVSYQWSPAGGTNSVATVRPPVSGTYSVTVRAPDGCSSVASIDIVVMRAPVAHAGPDVTICEGSRRVIGQNATSGYPPYTYSWTPAFGLNSASIPQPVASPPTTMSYIVTVTDSMGICTGRDTVIVTVNPAPKIAAVNDTTICFGSPAALSAFASGGKAPYTFQWTPAKGLDNPTKAAVTARPDSTTSYTVIVTDANGCTAADTVRVTVRAPLVASAGADTVMCVGDTVTLTATGGTGYRWSPAAGLSCTACRNPRAAPVKTTLYTVVITDAAGCSLTDSVLVRVQNARLVSNVPLVDFGALKGCQSSLEQSLVLRNSGIDTLRIDSMTFSSQGFSVLSPQLPIRVAPGDSIAVRLQFSPLASGRITAKLHVFGRPCGVDYVIDLTGEKLLTAVASRPTSIAFGDVYSCGQHPRDTAVVIYNTGTEPLQIDGGIVAAPYTVLSPSFPQTVAPGDSLVVMLRYAPVAEGNAAALLALPFRAGTCSDTLRIPLDARYLIPKLGAPSSVSFGELVGCAFQLDSIIIVHNPSAATIVLQIADVPSGFQLLTPLPITIAPGTDAPLTMRFAPGHGGSTIGRLLVAYGPCNDTLAIDLDGMLSGASYTMVPDTIDFGEVPDCGGALASKLLAITNTSGGGVGSWVDSVTIAGPFITSMRNGDTLPNGQQRGFTVEFQPTAPGAFAGTMEITIAPCGIRKIVTLKGVSTSAMLTGALQIDFLQVQTGASATVIRKFTNAGTADLVIDNINGPTAPFSVISTQPPLPAHLAPGEELTVTLGFDPMAVGLLQSAMTLHASPCDRSLAVNVTGEGINTSAWSAVSLGVLEAAPGQRVSVPLVIDSSRNLAAVGATNFELRLRFNKTLLYPVGATPMGTILGRERMINITGTRSDTIGEVSSFDFEAMLGDTEETPLTIEQFWWTDGDTVVITIASGSFRLLNVCRNGAGNGAGNGGGLRLLNAVAGAGLKPVRPNPASGIASIEYTLLEAGRAHLYLVDLLGRRVATVVDGDRAPGSYAAPFDTAPLASGLYFCVLETGRDRFVQGMQVGR